MRVMLLADWTDSSSVAVIVSQHTAKAFAALDLAVEASRLTLAGTLQQQGYTTASSASGTLE